MLHEDVAEIKNALRGLADAITKLALVEERQTNVTNQVDRAFALLEKMDERISAVEEAVMSASRTATWVDRLVWALAAATLVFAARHVGLLI
jgi:uncharacterized protein HemX